MLYPNEANVDPMSDHRATNTLSSQPHPPSTTNCLLVNPLPPTSTTKSGHHLHQNVNITETTLPNHPRAVPANDRRPLHINSMLRRRLQRNPRLQPHLARPRKVP